MSKRDLVLRLLLALAIVLNGMAIATAGTPHDRQAPPCHGDHAMADMGDMGDMPQPDHPEQPAPDCCEAGQCACACMQPAQAASPASIAAHGALAIPDVRPLVLGHPGPVLPQPIRPPIC